MTKTLRLSFSLRITYRVNAILYSLKQMPLIKRLLPQTLYSSRGLKLFAGVLVGIWELLSVFLGKLIYFLTMVAGASGLYEGAAGDGLFLHILFFLTVIGAFTNTSLFEPTRDKYYAIFLLGMDAREFTLVNYLYAMLKVAVGFLPFALLFGMGAGLPLWFCLLLPLCIAGMKLFVAATSLWDYSRRGHGYNENRLSKRMWALVALLLALAYGLPAAGMVLPRHVSMGLLLAFIPLGALGLWSVLTFRDYRALTQQLLFSLLNQMDSSSVTAVLKSASEKKISTDLSITSRRSGFEYLNELFVKRHKKILWDSSRRIAMVAAALFAGALLVMALKPELKPQFNSLVMNGLPYFVFIMYAINRGTNFTQALFLNCDHSLLTYPFYKTPGSILRLFQIRLREISKVNALPALVIGLGLSALLYLSGGTGNPLNYLLLVVSVLSLSLLFSVHYLTIYYLMQPYNAGTELKSGSYRVVMFVTYLVCYIFIQFRMPTLLFGSICTAFCAIYIAAASVLVYKLAPRTFRIRL